MLIYFFVWVLQHLTQNEIHKIGRVKNNRQSKIATVDELIARILMFSSMLSIQFVDFTEPVALQHKCMNDKYTAWEPTLAVYGL
jgi:hypothetical protein